MLEIKKIKQKMWKKVKKVKIWRKLSKRKIINKLKKLKIQNKLNKQKIQKKVSLKAKWAIKQVNSYEDNWYYRLNTYSNNHFL